MSERQPIARPWGLTDAHLRFLDGLQKRGKINAFDTRHEFANAFNLTESVARDYMAYWKWSYDNRHSDGVTND